MGAAAELEGLRFGRLVVDKRAKNSPNGHTTWYCKCDCGKRVIVFASNLLRNHTTSCGCVNDEIITKHGHWGSPEYWVWHGMMQRCENPNNVAYKYYGARGIKVSKKWRQFKNFYNDMCPRPNKNLTIERRNNDHGYSKFNCYWATSAEQQLNKRKKGTALSKG